MKEQSKSARRRFYDGNFHNKYFSGNGIDIGGRPDPFNQYIGVFPLVKSVKIWDLEDGDAQYMAGVENNTFDFVISSHCLEHMVNPHQALVNWVRITKPGGYLIITIPDEDLYEHGYWPSRYNADHKHTFTINKKNSWSEVSINLTDLLTSIENIKIHKIELITDFYNYNLSSEDQTLQPNVESAIEIIIKKTSSSEIIEVQKNRIYLSDASQSIMTSEELNGHFHSRLSSFISTVISLKSNLSDIVIYGYGNAGKVLEKFLSDKTLFIIDKCITEPHYSDMNIKLYPVDYVKNEKFKWIIISVLGREEEIRNELTQVYNVKNDKIILLNQS